MNSLLFLFFETACLVAFDSWPVSSVWLCIGKSLLTMPWQCLLWLQWLQRMTKSFLMSLTIIELWYSIPRVSELQQKWSSAILASQIPKNVSDYQWTCVWFWPPILSEYKGFEIWVLHDFTSVGLFPSQTNQFSRPICTTNSRSQKLLFYYLIDVNLQKLLLWRGVKWKVKFLRPYFLIEPA